MSGINPFSGIKSLIDGVIEVPFEIAAAPFELLGGGSVQLPFQSNSSGANGESVGGLGQNGQNPGHCGHEFGQSGWQGGSNGCSANGGGSHGGGIGSGIGNIFGSVAGDLGQSLSGATTFFSDLAKAPIDLLTGNVSGSMQDIGNAILSCATFIEGGVNAAFDIAGAPFELLGGSTPSNPGISSCAAQVPTIPGGSNGCSTHSGGSNGCSANGGHGLGWLGGGTGIGGNTGGCISNHGPAQNVSGNTINFGDGSKVVFSNQTATYTDAKGNTTQLWGDPHLTQDGKAIGDFYGTTTFNLDNGATLVLDTTQSQNGGVTYLTDAAVTSGGQTSIISGLNNGTISVNTATGALSNAISRGLTLNQTANGTGWNDAATGQAVTQAELNATKNEVAQTLRTSDIVNNNFRYGNYGNYGNSANNSINQLLTGMAGGTYGGYGSTGASGGTGGILARIAEALGAAADNQMNQMSSLASQIGNVSSSNQSQFASLSGELNAAGQQFGIISQATNTVLNAIGSGEEQLARKQ